MKLKSFSIGEFLRSAAASLLCAAGNKNVPIARICPFSRFAQSSFANGFSNKKIFELSPTNFGESPFPFRREGKVEAISEAGCLGPRKEGGLFSFFSLQTAREGGGEKERGIKPLLFLLLWL